MSIIPNTNQRYLTSNGMSVYSLKQNTNQFLTDLAKLEQKNRIGNGYFSSVVADPTFPIYWPINWTLNNVTTFEYNNTSKSSLITIAPSGSIMQNINYLRPNESYTAIIFSSCPVSGSLEFGIFGNPNQVFNTNDLLEINKATTLVSTSNSVTKNIVQFNTNTTSVSGSVYVQLKNISSSIINIEIQKILVYKGLIELDDVMNTDILEEVVYSSMVISDSLDNTSYEFFVYDNALIQYDLTLEESKKVYVVLINDSASGVSQTYALRVFDGLLDIESVTYNSAITKEINIDDVASGIKYDFTITNGISGFTAREYIDSLNVLVDQAVSGVHLGAKYILEVKNDVLDALVIDPLCSTTSPTGFYIRDCELSKSYLVNMNYGILTLTEVTFNTTHSFYRETKNYILNMNYRIFVRNGIVETATVGASTKRWFDVYGVNFMPGDGNTEVKWTSGAGSPEGSVIAKVGSLYTRNDGGANTTLYVKESGINSIGWIPK